MAGEQEIASTGALEKYLTRIQKQVRQLGLMKANPILNAVDLITGKIDAISVRFEQMTSKMKMLSIDISMKPNWSNFEQAGTEAGKVFTDAFIAAFDSDKLAQKAKDSLESIKVNVNLKSDGEIDWKEKAIDFGLGVLGGLIVEGIMSGPSKTIFKKVGIRIGGMFSGAGKSIGRMFSGATEGARQLFSGAGKSIGRMFSGATGGARQLFSGAGNRIGQVFNNTGRGIGKWLENSKKGIGRFFGSGKSKQSENVPDQKPKNNDEERRSRRKNNKNADTDPPNGKEPENRAPKPNPKGSRFRRIFEAGKDLFFKMRSSSDIAMLGISESSAGRSPSNAGGQGRQGSGSSRSFGKRSYTNLSPQSKFSATEPATSNAVKSLTANTRLAAGPLAKSALKLTGKLFRPLGLISDAMAITGAETVEERNKAIGSAVGGWGGAAAGAAAGAAIGSVVPVIGTAIGGLVGGAIGGLGGSAVGEFVGGKAKEATNKIKGWFGFGKKKKKEEDPVALPAPPEPKPVALPSPTVTNPLVSPFSQVPATPPAMPINVNVPYGAIQITVHNPDIDYEQISAQIGSRFATSIQQAMENRA